MKKQLTVGERLLNKELAERTAQRDEYQARNERQAAEIRRLKLEVERLTVEFNYAVDECNRLRKVSGEP